MDEVKKASAEKPAGAQQAGQQSGGRVKVPARQALGMLLPYMGSKVLEQIKSVWLIVLYLAVFQVFVLGIPIAQASVVTGGIALVILGLAFFMEGLFLGLMPLGETCGVKLPQRAALPLMMVFAFILGVGATFAEPAIGVLQAAGSSVKPWDAPLLFLLLNKYSHFLKYAVGAGVGIAVIFGMLRFLYSWSLKPFLYILVTILSAISIWAWLDPNMAYVTGVAWDCGGVTTGPVTVPLVLALGIGVSRVIAKRGSSEGSGAAGGFGVVTLASAFPILTVLALGMFLMGNVPRPMPAEQFCAPENRSRVVYLFASEEELTGYVFKNAPLAARSAYFNGDPALRTGWLSRAAADETLAARSFGSTGALKTWALSGSVADEERIAIYGSREAVQQALDESAVAKTAGVDIADLISRNVQAAAQAILPLSLFLFIALKLMREKLGKPDETALGIVLAVIGMSIFSIGIELGLSRLGGQAGEMLPSSFKSIELVQQRQVIRNFDPGVVRDAVMPDGGKVTFFFQTDRAGYVAVPYDSSAYDAATARYVNTPRRGPLFGAIGGIAVAILFAFVLGYGATLAEPALNALGQTVEDLTVGTFKKSLLMQAVAIGVGVGIAVGVVRVVFDLPLVWLLVPPYAILLFLSKISTEDFVNIGWDSAGVTTGPVTVPLVLAMGLGIGGQVGVVEGFGILSLASVYPILAVIVVGLVVTARRKAALREAAVEKAA